MGCRMDVQDRGFALGPTSWGRILGRGGLPGSCSPDKRVMAQLGDGL